MEEKILEAAKLAAWLMREKGKKRNIAVLIGCYKHKVPLLFRSLVSKKATEHNKRMTTPVSLFD